ncbi:head scaffolding protein [Ralstonia phage phiAp1]|uniref:Scaffolding protein n=1 Tax=Ralstonia phage phiAp1 TaxID=2783867 RepID=A0A1L7DS73_9CAUD|nr:head scaffolding protein [Ralstonia phage phiAp1]APU03180.1 scaffolding protein [Ralstonia phage phiAp1]
MAEHVAIPPGFNPNNAVPADAEGVVSHSRGQDHGGNPPGQPGGLPAVPPSGAQTPGFTPAAPAAPAAPADDAALFEQFKAWKAAQDGKTTPAAEPEKPVAPPAKVEPPASATLGASESLQALTSAAASDPYLMSTMKLFELAAPDVDMTRAIGNALDHGDLTRIDRAYLKEKGGDKADHLIATAEGLVKHVTDTIATVTKSVYDQAGGEQAWSQAVAAFNKHAPGYAKQFVAAAMNSGDKAKIQQATADVLKFVKDNGHVVVEPQGHVRGNGGSVGEATGLSKQQYIEARAKLDRNARDYNDRARELDARRQIGKNQGL